MSMSISAKKRKEVRFDFRVTITELHAARERTNEVPWRVTSSSFDFWSAV